jgi:ABC-type bacteriocin/lantibiotic exporter with double-glycine peptidase domain
MRSPRRAVLPDFTLIRQPDPISCGPTCIAMVLRHYGVAEDAATYPQRLRPRVRMMSPQGLADALTGRGVAASVQRGDLGRLVEALDQGRPAILLVRLTPYMWHYVVAIGYQGRGERFRLADPYGLVDWIDAQALEHAWAFDGDLRGHRIEELPCGVCDGGRRDPHCSYCGGTGGPPTPPARSWRPWT